jgi:hypothetical protein
MNPKSTYAKSIWGLYGMVWYESRGIFGGDFMYRLYPPAAIFDFRFPFARYL